MIQTRTLPAGQDKILGLLARKAKSVLFLKLSVAQLESFGQLRQGNVVAPRDFTIILQLIGVPDVNQDSSAFSEQGCQLLESYNTHGRVHSSLCEICKKTESREKVGLELSKEQVTGTLTFTLPSLSACRDLQFYIFPN